MNRPFVAFEALSATAQGAPHLLELGAVRVVDGEVEASLDALACPLVPVDPQVSAETGIEDPDLRRGREPAEILAAFADFTRGELLVAHDAERAARVLGFECARTGVEAPAGMLACTRALARRHLDPGFGGELEDLGAELELSPHEHGDLGDPTRALGRAVHAWKILEACHGRAGSPAGDAWPFDAETIPTTIDAHGPRAPRLSPRLRPLERAWHSGETITVLYGLGDPARLPVRPTFLFERGGKGYFEGECQRTGSLKTYLLERVRKVL